MRTGVIVMAHGTPDRLEDMGEYLGRILTRRPPTPELIGEFQSRYRQIGGRSPLLDITRSQARLLSEELKVPVFVGMRHWTPTIAQAAEQARKEGVERVVGLALAPQFARISVGAYLAELNKTGIPSVGVESWHLEPGLLGYWRRVTQGKPFVLFTAHSIPAEGAEPYPAQLAQMVREIASGPHLLAYQSRSPSPQPWLGPEVAEVLRTLKGKVSVAPIGFLCDHVEILYDLDILHRKQAEALGLTWDRLPMPNTDPLVIQAMASAVRKHL